MSISTIVNDTACMAISCRKKISVALSDDEIRLMMEILTEEFPDPKPALHFKNAFELLCAVMLSAQATDASVNQATPQLFAKAPDPEAMVKLGAEGIAPFIKSIGLWRVKSKNLELMSEQLLQRHHGMVPDDYVALRSLSGVGEKTAAVIMNVIYHKPYIAVDTHIFRVCCRTGLCVGKNALDVQHALAYIIPLQYQNEAHHRLLYHGRFVCTAKKPDCKHCVLSALCKSRKDFDQKTSS